MFSTKPGFVSFEKGIMLNFDLQKKHGGHFCDGEFAKCYSTDGFPYHTNLARASGSFFFNSSMVFFFRSAVISLPAAPGLSAAFMGEEGDAGLMCHWPMLCKINFEPMSDGLCCFLAPPVFLLCYELRK